jgi:hypothetical protein
VELWRERGAQDRFGVKAAPPFILAADGDLGLTLYATADGAVRPATGTAAAVFPATPLVITFAQGMDTTSVNFTCTPDPGGWVASWDTAFATEARFETGRLLTLDHNPFAENQEYTFQITRGTTAGGQPIDPFGLDFFVVEIRNVFLPQVMRGK